MERIAPAIDLSRAARILIVAALVESGVFLGGWLAGPAAFAPFLGRAMKANTCVAVFVASIALLIQLQKVRSGAHSRHWRRAALALGAAVFGIGVITFLQYATGSDFGIDQFLALDVRPILESARFPGRMSPIAAVGFLFIGAQIFLLHLPGRRGALIHQAFSLTLALFSIMALVGYLLGVSSFYKVAPFNRISPFTAVTFLMLSVANLFLRPESPFMRLVISQTPGGMAVRRMLPLALFLPPCIGFFRLLGQQVGYYDTATGTSISVMSYIIVFSVFIYWVARQMNISARERYETEQKFLSAETARANELQAALRTRDEFLSIASHELKTPLTSLKLQLQMQKRAFAKDPGLAAGTGQLVKFFDSSDRQILRISRLIEDMLDVGRIHSGKFTLSPEDFDLVDLVKEVCEQMAAELTAAGCPLSLSLPPTLPGRWDRIRLGQVLSNLLSNAAKYGSGKPIAVNAEFHDDRVRLVVADHGEGIAPVNHRRIFERFERAVPGTHISGLGLGLFIVKQIVDLHGGWIRVDSELGQGATFTVDVPQRTA